jgi:hypothetical protein
MTNINNKLNIIRIILIFLFIGCLFDWEYGYYQLVRFLGMIGFGILAFNSYEKNKTWFVIWLSSMILINPIFKIALGRELWNIIDVIWAILLVVSIFSEDKLEEHAES